MNKYMVRAIKVVSFLLVGALILGEVSHTLFRGYDSYNYQMVAGFFSEPKDSLDVVYIGPSTTFSSWVAPVAYKKYGIATRVFGNDNQPFVAAKSLLKIARERQPNAVYFITLNTIFTSTPVEAMHMTTDYLPFSLDRINLINKMSEYFLYTPEEWLELVYPFVRYHSTWNMLNEISFHPQLDGLKSGFNSQTFLGEVKNISSYYFETSEKSPLPDFTQSALIELLDYCREENVKVIFVLSVQYKRDEETLRWYNTLIDEIEAQGFPVINEVKDFNIIGLDDTTDFYNANHTNIHGALKVTDYLAQYLLEHYDFPEKSSGGGYESWDIAYEKYKELITPYLTEEELAQLP